MCHRATVLLMFVVAAPVQGQTLGWRGNWTGLYPDAHPPLEWSRIAVGAMQDLRASAQPPAGDGPESGVPVQDGFIREWLVLGPFRSADSVREFDTSFVPDETDVHPADGVRVGDMAWRPLKMKPEDRWELGPAELPWIDPALDFGYEDNRVAYLHTYLYSPRGGPVRGVVEHSRGLQLWLNGASIYRQPDRGSALGTWSAISRWKLSETESAAPVFECELQPGWNRLLAKVASCNQGLWKEMRFTLRLMDPPDVRYESHNIAWMSPLPEHSNAAPVLVAGRLFVMSEPDELLCIDAQSGTLKWRAAHNYAEAATAEERRQYATWDSTIAPQMQRVRDTDDPTHRREARRALRQALVELDPSRFEYHADGHFESHFAIVGFTTPTPCSDGRLVYVWCGNGVAAAYDLDGRRQWITRVDAAELSYPSSPALIGNRFVVFMRHLYGLDAETGAVVWEQRRINRNNAAVSPARLAGVDVVVSQQGDVVRADDGAVLFRLKEQVPGDNGWAAPVINGNVVYLPRYGVSELIILDFTGVSGDEWQPQIVTIGDISVNRRTDGRWLDRWMAASPLLDERIVYAVDIYATAYAIDVRARSTLYRQDLDLRGLFHYNALPVAASPVLAGGHVYYFDNQGNTIVAAPGREFRQVARNRIATQLSRVWPINPQETIANAPPVCEGGRMYVRGEAYLYCIGEE